MNIGRFLLVCLFAGVLSACGTVNSWLAQSMGNHVPHWAGGMPEDAPPRPGTPEYEEYRKKLEGNAAQPSPAPEPARASSSTRAVY